MAQQEERHQIILSLLQSEGRVVVTDLSDRLSVSAVTIRKDLKALEQRGLLYRTHGGARLHNPYVTDRPVSEKAQVQAEEKERIGRAAADMVAPRDTVLFASGTTVHTAARQVAAQTGRNGTHQLTVLTSSIGVAQALAPLPQAEVLLLGGIVRPSSFSVIGPYATALLADHACDKLFLGVDGFDIRFGLTTTNALEAELNQAMMRAAQRTVVLVDSSKFGRRGFRRICGVGDVDLVITDDGVSAETLRRLDEHGIEVETV